MAIGSGTTSRGYHYLVPSDAPDIAGITQQLATDINTDVGNTAALVADTGWKNITLNTTNYQSAGNTPQYRIKAGVVYLRGDVKPVGGGNFPASGIYNISSNGLPIPDGGQPAADRLLTTGGASVVMRGVIDGAGTLNVQTSATAAAVVNLSGMSGYTTTATS